MPAFHGCHRGYPRHDMSRPAEKTARRLLLHSLEKRVEIHLNFDPEILSVVIFPTKVYVYGYISPIAWP